MCRNLKVYSITRGARSRIGIATNHGHDSPKIESRRGGGEEIPTTIETGPGKQAASCTMDNGSFPRGKRAAGARCRPFASFKSHKQETSEL